MPFPEADSAHFKRQYTDHQRDAVLDAHLRLGISQRAIVKHCRAGSLPDPKRPGESIPAFDMSRATIGNLIRKSGDDYRAFLLQDNGEADRAMDRIQGRVAQALEAKLRDLEERQKAGEEIPVRQWQELAAAATAARRLIRPVGKQNAKPREPENDRTGRNPPESGGGSVLGRLGVE